MCDIPRIRSTHLDPVEEWRGAKGDNWPHPERGVPWTNQGGGHRSAQCMHPGASTRSQRAREGGQTHD
jgi:hypothetical protein